MREILFRAWLKKDKKMVEVKSIHFGTKKIMYGYSESSHCYGNVTCSFDDCELMQFTGLTDKNGKMIFEGDIVKINGWWNASGPAGYSKNLTVVEFNDELCGFTPMCIYDSDCGVYHCAEDTEVIGNIYDNPELLGGAE